MLLVWKARQDIELLKTKALVNAALIAGQEGSAERNKLMQESWTDYMDAVYPASKSKAKTQDQKALDFMHKEIKKGALRVVPLEPLTRAGKRRHGRNQKQ